MPGPAQGLTPKPDHRNHGNFPSPHLLVANKNYEAGPAMTKFYDPKAKTCTLCSRLQ